MGQRGQILLETIISVAILTIAIIGLLYGISNTTLAVSRISKERVAMNLASSQMEYIKAQEFDSSYDSLPDEDLPEDWTTGDKIDIVVKAIEPDYLECITVKISYSGRNVELKGYKSSR